MQIGYKSKEFSACSLEYYPLVLAKGRISNKTLNLGMEAKDSTLSKILPWLILALAALGILYFVQNGFG